MSVKSNIMVGAVVLAMASSASLALADAGKINVDTSARGTTLQAEAVAHVSMAQDLIAYGDANKDAMSLIVAAGILKANPTHALDAKKATEGEAAKSGKKSSAEADNSVASVLIRAKKYAAGRKDLIAMANDVASSSSRGRIQGPGDHRDRVSSHHTDVYKLTYRGGESAIFGIRGDGDTDLDFYVYDENDHLITSDTDSTDIAVLRWHPKWTGKFTIKIKNRGNVFNRYRFVTN